MKKLLAKLVIMVITSAFLSTYAFADNTATPTPTTDTQKKAEEELDPYKDIFGNITNDFCYSPEQEKSYLVTVTETSLLKEEKKEEKKEDKKEEKNFIVKKCYRNTFFLKKDKKKEIVITKLLNKCSPQAMEKAKELNNKNDTTAHLSCQEVQVILSKGGTTLLEGYISMIYKWAAGLVGIISVTVIIISGIQISLSGSDTEALESAKERIGRSIAGLAILFLSSLILYTTNPTFFTR